MQLPPPFKFWGLPQWMNFVIFLSGAVLAVGITAATRWDDLPKLFTPFIVLGFIISLAGFLNASNTNAGRDPTIGTRRSDPSPTAPLEQVGPTIMAVPPVNPGRPIDPTKEQP